ncbi:hypothetical protein MLD38_013064 [Melastoma candidum]|uniref:Uncharacterized protein n=1 Tax=Melastoma candidum TaxID=119954 RepID=A0ACB9R8C0_9MYRT|nr:hypothetical protein MLD38_013064 [Melastoma candidum]
MPATDFQGSYIGRSILSLRRDQAAHLMEGGVGSPHEPPSALEVELEAFQRQVTDRFLDLSGCGRDELLSLPWIRKLLDVFLLCKEEFRSILFNHQSQLSKPPMDRMISDFYEKSIKSLDVCNAIRDGIDQIRQWEKLLEIVLCALDKEKNLGEGQFRRAKKALVDLAISMLDEKDSGTSSMSYRNRSFGRNNASTASRDHRTQGHFRSLSWSVSRSWSAARQIQAIGNNLYAPRGNEVIASNGLAVAVYTMNCVLLLVMWVLVAAIPCQDRGLQVHFSMPRQFPWAGPLLLLHERITEESKKRDRRNACGLLREIHSIEKRSRLMSDLVDSLQFPLSEEREGEVRESVEELANVYKSLKEGIDLLEKQVREVFHRIVRSRTEGLDYMGKSNAD